MLDIDLNTSTIRCWDELIESLPNSIFVMPAKLHSMLNSSVSLSRRTSDLNTELVEK